MQIMLDTATDAPADLYRIGKFLVAEYATPVAPPLTELLAPDDIDVETDNGGSVTALTTSVSLPPPAPSAPPTPGYVPLPPGPAVPAELDANGVPWDGRIHSSNRAKRIDGTWRGRRGLGVPLTPSPVVAKVQHVPVTQEQLPAAVAAMKAPPPPPPPVVPAATVPAGAPTMAVVDFRGLMQKIQTASAAGKLLPDHVNAALLSVGLQPQDMAQLIDNAPLIASVNAAIDKFLATT